MNFGIGEETDQVSFAKPTNFVGFCCPDLTDLSDNCARAIWQRILLDYVTQVCLLLYNYAGAVWRKNP